MKIKNIILLILGFFSLEKSVAQNLRLKQIEQGTATGLFPVTNGKQKTLVYRNLKNYLIDSLAIDSSNLNEIQLISKNDFTRVVTLSKNGGTFKDSVLTEAQVDSYANNNGYLISETDGSITNEIELPTQSGQDGKVLSTLAGSPQWITMSGGMDSLFNGNRTISRVPTVGINMGTTTFRQWLSWWYVGNYTQPTITMNTLSSPLEYGTSNNITISGATTNPCGYTLSSGTVIAPVNNNFGSATSYSTNYTHAIASQTSTTSTTYTVNQSWVMTTTSCQGSTPTTGTATANRSISNVHPFLFGMSSVDYSGSGTVPYTGWSKRVANQNTQQTAMTMNGTNQFIYILVPKSWSDFTVTSIIDPNAFNVTSAFTAYDVNITSTGLTTNWTTAYKMYKLNNLTTATNFNYIYNP